MKVIFLGNHDVGIATLTTLKSCADIVGVVAHPIDPEEGMRFASVYQFARRNDLRVIRGRGTDAIVFKFIQRLKPDLIWVTDYRYLLPKTILSIPKLGSVNLHPSLLPEYRGRAPINWAILKGEQQIGVTAHFLDEGVDTGDIIKQIPLTLDKDQDVSHALKELIPLYQTLTSDVIDFFRAGDVPRQTQSISQGSIFRARTPEDGRIDWSRPAKEINNLVRAVTSPYPGAFTSCKTTKIYIWKSKVLSMANQSKFKPGSVIALGENDQPKVQCGSGVLEILNWTQEIYPVTNIRVGDRFV